MKLAVRYFTRSGNTKRLAEAVAQALGQQALDLSHPLSERVDLLVLGCSYYAFDVDPAVKSFLLENRLKIGRLVCVGTSAMMRSLRGPLSRAAKRAQIPLDEREFHCRGQFHKAHPGRPNEKDLERAACFAKQLLAEETGAQRQEEWDH